MPRKTHKINGKYNDRLKQIRKYVDFDYDLRKPLAPAQKGKINKYWEFIQDRTQGDEPIKSFRGRKKQHIETAKAAAGTPPELKDLNTAFFTTTSGDIKIKFDKEGNLTIKNDFVDTSFLPLDPDELLSDNAEDYINDLVTENGFDKYTMTYGEWDSHDFDAPNAAGEVMRLINNPKYTGDPQANHYFENWLFGINGLTFKSQRTLDMYLSDKKEAQIRRKKNAKNKRK